MKQHSAVGVYDALYISVSPLITKKSESCTASGIILIIALKDTTALEKAKGTTTDHHAHKHSIIYLWAVSDFIKHSNNLK